MRAKFEIKICGITQTQQAQAIAQMGATALGYICVEASPRYISPQHMAPIITAVNQLPQTDPLEHFGVFVDAPLLTMVQVAQTTGLTVLQLHGEETPATCQLLRDALAYAGLPEVVLVKALRIHSAEALETALAYRPHVDRLLLDAYHPTVLGGTGHTLDWQSLQTFSPGCPWYLAGGLTPENILTALSLLNPSGIDLSSGVERSPGDKDLAKVSALFEQLKRLPANR